MASSASRAGTVARVRPAPLCCRHNSAATSHYGVVPDLSTRDDEQLLVDIRSTSAGASFAVFYQRHERAVLAFFRRRVSSPELAADLTAECFAQALASRRRFRDRGSGSALAWLFGIATNLLRRSYEKGRVEDRARRELGLHTLELTTAQIELVDALGAESAVDETLQLLPAEQRTAIRARIIDERSYREIADTLSCSEAVVRQRVSRGLGALRRTTQDFT